MSDEQSTPKTDGGRPEDVEIFGQIGDTERARVSPAERMNRLLDLYVYRPFQIAWNDWRARIGGLIVLFYLLMGTAGVALVSEPQTNEGPRYLGPFESTTWQNHQGETVEIATTDFLLGTDALGQSITSTLVHGTPAMLRMALAGVLFSAGVAVIIGVVAGYKGGVVDKTLMTLTDIVLTLPGLPLILVIAAIYPPSDPFMVGVIVAIDSWPGLARQLRSQVMTIREESYVEAARAMGMPTSTILNREVIPQLAPYILINAAGAAVGVIATSVSLYFLGILPITDVNNWGVMMNMAYTESAIQNPGRTGHWLLFPALALSGLSFGLILFSQGLDRVFNPRLRARNSEGGDLEIEDDEPGTTSVTPTQ